MYKYCIGHLYSCERYVVFDIKFKFIKMSICSSKVDFHTLKECTFSIHVSVKTCTYNDSKETFNVFFQRH